MTMTSNYNMLEEVFSFSKIGLCSFEFSKEHSPKMFMDDFLRKQLNIPDIEFPENIFEFWYKHIDSAYIKQVEIGLNRLKAGISTEFTYAFQDSPEKDKIYFTLYGVKDITQNDNDLCKIEVIQKDVTDSIIKDKAYEARLQELQIIEDQEITYAGIAEALGRDFECVFYVNVVTGEYNEYSSNGEYRILNLASEGTDFFSDQIDFIKHNVFIADLRRVEKFMTEMSDLSKLTQTTYSSIQYRVLVDGKPVYYSLSVVPSLKEDREHYIFGIRNIDEQMRQENDYKEKIRRSVELANKDPMTGVNNRLAYDNNREMLNNSIETGTANPFSIALFDINGLKYTNDTYGHETGDELICNASRIICEHFKHSRVYRIGGDEFSAILIGNDYFQRLELIKSFRKKAQDNHLNGGIVIASGLADFSFDTDKSFEDIFNRADENMYQDKKDLKFIQ